MDERLRRLEQLAALGDAEAIELLRQWQLKLTRETNEERAVRLEERKKIARRAQAIRIINAGKLRARTRNLSETLSSLESLEIFDGWAEGSGDSDVLVIAGSWNGHDRNDDTLDRVKERLQKLSGVEIDWYDEIARCEDCQKAISTTPAHYGWIAPFVVYNNEIVCRGCICENPREYLEFLEGHENRALTAAIQINLLEHGYRRVEMDFESGHDPGQNDSSVNIARRLRHLGIDRFIFRVDAVGQFDQNWSVYISEDELVDFIVSAAAEAGFLDVQEFIQRLNPEMEFGSQPQEVALNIIQQFLEIRTLIWPTALNDWLIQPEQETQSDNDEDDDLDVDDADPDGSDDLDQDDESGED